MKLFFVRTLSIGALMACFFVAGSSAAAAVITHAGDTVISSDTVWREGDVHIITGAGAVVDFGVTLTIESGAVVKFDQNSGLLVAGKLRAFGTVEKPAVFTSFKDDKYGGDANGDGSATLPAPGDWASIMVPVAADGRPVDGDVILDHAIVSYGGRLYGGDYFAFVVGQASKFSIADSELFDNIGPVVILPQANNFSINHSNIYAPDYCQEAEPGVTVCGGGIMSQSSATFDAGGNYWGSASGPSVMGPGGISWGGVALNGNFNYQPFSVQKLDLFQSAASKRHPVILIPGILGSWPDMDNQKLILDPITHTYDDLYAAIEQAGYVPGATLFAFPYEWRNSNVITAQLLKNKIAAVKASCPPSEIMDCSKVDLIGHSMGGLVARQYIESDDYADDVDQMIFIATPHKGAPKAYATWEGGYMGEENVDKILGWILKLEAFKKIGEYSNSGLVAYLHDYNINSVKELLPIYSYIYDENLGRVRYYPDNYPINLFLENLNTVDNLNKLKSAVKVTNIVGNIGDSTISGFSVVSSTKPLPMWANGMPNDFYGSKSGVLTNSGDGTVPALSNSSFIGLTPIVINQNHGQAVSYAQSQIIKELTGSLPTMEIHNNYGVESYLMISLRCPADIQVIAPDGQRLGRNLAGTSTIAEIPGGYYYNSGDETKPEFVIIPNPQEGEYQVKVIGTDNGGSYTVDTNYISDATSTEVAYSGVILPGQEQSLNFSFSSDAAQEIKADITIQTAISDVSLIYSRGLLTDNLAKQKVITKYAALKFKVTLTDAAIKLAESARIALINNVKLSASIKAKLLAALDSRLIKFRLERQKIILAGLADINSYLSTLQAANVLKPLGYDIIKSNNDYLINNW